MSFRDRLLGSLRAMQPILEVSGVMVAGSQVPNLLERDAASTLVVSQDVDLVIPVSKHDEVKAALDRVHGFSPAPDEPSVWLPDDPRTLEVNFIGLDPSLTQAADTYVLDDERLPLMVFGLLSHLREGAEIEVDNVRIPIPRPAGLMIEKLLTERGGLKGERDRLVAAGLLQVCDSEDVREVIEIFRGLPAEQKESVLANLTILSLMKPMEGMPDPERNRDVIAALVLELQTMS